MGIGTDDLLIRVTDLRRSLHQFPELGHHERRTAELVESALEDIGLRPFRPGGTSVAVAVGPPGRRPAVGFRAELDAVQLFEANDVPYRSRTPGVMHACGHDGHAAALVGLAIALQNVDLDEPVLLVFQQAEESRSSGAPIVLEALSPEFTPQAFYGFHLWPQLPENVVGVRAGPMLAAVAGVEILVRGRPGRAHGTDCGEGGADALAAGIELYRRLLHEMPSGRRFLAGSTSALTIGRIQGGEAPNSVAVCCTLSGTLRARSWQEESNAARRIRTIASEVAALTGTQLEVRVESGIRPPVTNDPSSTRRIEEACRRLGIEYRTYPDVPVGVSDDFGWYLDGRPGAWFFVGCGATDAHPGLHEPCFNFNERVLLVPIRIGVELARHVVAGGKLTKHPGPSTDP